MERVIYENWRPESRRMTEVVIDDETSLPLIRHVQNVRPIIEANKRLSNAYDRHRKAPDGWTLVARIDINTWRQLHRTGVAKDPKAFDAWLDNPAHRHYRTDGGRRLS